ncbi:Lrp/AsnC family transcriptional regulator [Kytococcus sedentarius]|uniref:Lrp/AsnC family transcriptional regulator n=1 Tax=Kytococcus sedentarius TaxID=1276 RepID=UPI00194F1E24|nr:Lrp/AsnC ligand binding domain-containing protein [Kytococcus sedentarius]QRO86529.1 Lrp/AsnC ligand binding domain-containing protein [Kytococcus sedentarius]
MISAIVLIHAESAKIPQVAQSIVEIPGIEKVYSTAGAVDLIAVVQVERHEDFADVIADRLNKVQGVTDTETHIAFRTYSADDEAQAFAIGLDS